MVKNGLLHTMSFESLSEKLRLLVQCIGVECQLEVGSTVAVMRWKSHDDQSAPYGNEGPGAGLVLPIVGCVSQGSH